ncbi:MAG: hypothetical protein A2887_05140 [Alphaproteobacteria bacterium RIFCSPLOWO2_01_FULL_40_26]|nr:MAG: hypothetical protein A3D15_03660 [Alphaproteobacteria bacterium RIFCSPHIGHO2_02_FULL_40_34]OFW85621.1 MAG: hypothetical protein A2794_01255 [Alphaproteobacteria bacterium RIFCSPHIGHO2_01_FULL_40_8]OFW94319.1 MAG: hypothetical protein A2887_05140 [Alphaproteobacteria bacterium RIFCSPLOWO2_01_FULL_40_26]OFX10004.1 MAG: hypothetical protein A3H30_02930 [Alphaproteobacteria bacterium RIFCSPLOWO2_02_FULL_40_19]OFX11083.1 MAG: hypothetical protein A3G22_05835 [Alphaproteobacteria bacterium RI
MTPAEIRFEKARKRLADMLKNLEEVIKEKLHEAAINSIDISDNEKGAQAWMIGQEGVIQNLNEEINNLQKSLSDLGKETEFLREKNQVLANKISKFRDEGKSLIEAIEADLLHIEEVIKNDG